MKKTSSTPAKKTAVAERPTSDGAKSARPAPTAASVTGHDDVIDSKTLLRILRQVRKGDFTVRLPEDQLGAAAEIAEVLNDVIDLNDRMAREFERVSRAVGREGRINQRAS